MDSYSRRETALAETDERMEVIALPVTLVDIRAMFSGRFDCFKCLLDLLRPYRNSALLADWRAI